MAARSALPGRFHSLAYCCRLPPFRCSPLTSGSGNSARSLRYGRSPCSCLARSCSELRTTAAQVLHTFLLDYLPFIILLFTLFVVAGGIRVSGNLVGTPATNSALLTFG